MFKAHRLVYHSTLGLRVIKKKGEDLYHTLSVKGENQQVAGHLTSGAEFLDVLRRFSRLYIQRRKSSTTVLQNIIVMSQVVTGRARHPGGKRVPCPEGERQVHSSASTTTTRQRGFPGSRKVGSPFPGVTKGSRTSRLFFFFCIIIKPRVE